MPHPRTLPLLFLFAAGLANGQSPLQKSFASPPPSARPWVYWYFMEGNMSRAGMAADLESMRQAGLGGGILLEVNIGIPRGPIRYMSPEWLGMMGYAVNEADRLGLGIDFGTGPGWCGTGGPWVTPDQAMQHLVSSETNVVGPSQFTGSLPQPRPRTPYFGIGTLNPTLRKQWDEFYRDEVVLAVPTPESRKGLSNLDEKALVYRSPFSSVMGVKPFLEFDSSTSGSPVPSAKIVDLTSRMKPNGQLDWQVPVGNWTIMRFGRTLTGQTTRPAPDAGLGFETDKFETTGIDAHLSTFIDHVLKSAGPTRHLGRGLTALHFDSWEMSSQNWSAHFRNLFRKRRGYDPIRFLPVMTGMIVDSVEISERFLWDLRQTAQELVVENHLGPIKKKAKKNGLGFSLEPYDMNPTSDLALGEAADEPMCEFWSKGYGYRSEYSCFEAVSIAHTNGKPIVGAEAFTADDRDAWLQHPGSMKEQGDWALATGINKFYFHRYQHQPNLDEFPGMTMGPYGVHWERTQTWWDMVPAYHEYLARCQEMLRQGLPVADVLYLVPEGAPNVFQPPKSATIGDLPDRRGYNFDGCAPEALLRRARVKNGQIVFPDGMSYRLLVLPRFETMTPALLRKIHQFVLAGATVVGNPPKRSPSLSGYPGCDTEIQQLVRSLWGDLEISDRSVGKGRVIRAATTEIAPTAPPLESARWIWENKGDPATSAEIGKQRFYKRFVVPEGRALVSATVSMTADNTFWLSVNGKDALYGTDFHEVRTADVQRLLVSGANTIDVIVANDGTAPNPAGVIGTLTLRFADGGTEEIRTDNSWTVNGTPAKDLGPVNMAPWSIRPVAPTRELYPPYEFTARVLQNQLATKPDLSADDRLRYAHRKTKEGDLYFVANREASAIEVDATFRVSGRQPEWWDPKTGEVRRLTQFTLKDSTTVVPLKLQPFESGFVIFRHPAMQSQKGAPNFALPVSVGRIDTPWTVDFDPKLGGPLAVPFNELTDWRFSANDSIRHFSGKAMYRTTFDAPNAATILSLGKVANMASVRLNGKDLGVVWSAPWQVTIPGGILKPTGNVLEVTVANLWGNRLISDSALPADRRVTKTTWSPFQPDSPLLESGLFGPVQLMR